MSFANPTLLFALFAVAIPILIHLFDLQRPQKIAFTNVSILKAANFKTNSSRRLKNLLILLCRILFIVFLVLAFAQPFIPNLTNTSNPKIGIYVDNSLSLKNSSGTQSNLEKIIVSVNQFIKLFSASTDFYFLDNNFDPKDKNALNREKLTDRLTEINFSANSKSPDQVLQRMKSLSGDANAQFFLFSDFQKNGKSNFENIVADTSSQLFLVPFQNKEGANAFVDSVWLENPFLKANQNNKLFVKVKNGGTKAIKQTKVKLFIAYTQLGFASVSLEGKESKVVSFDFSIANEDSVAKCKLELDDTPNDFDNQYFFTLKPIKEINILEIASQRNSYFEKAFKGESIFRFTFNNFGNVSISDLNKANLIIINGIEGISGNDLKFILENTSQEQTTLVLAKGNVENENKLAENVKLLGLAYRKIDNISTSKVEIDDYLKAPDLRNAFFKGIFEKSINNVEVPYAKAVFQLNEGIKLLQNAGEYGILYKSKTKNKAIYTFSTVLEKGYSNLQFHSFFLPIIYKIAINATNENRNLSYSSQNNNIQVENIKKGTVKVKNAKIEFVTDLKIIKSKGFVNLPSVYMEPGFYNIWKGDSLISVFAFNYNNSESLLDFYSTEELKTLFATNGNVKVFENILDSNFIESYKNKYQNISLWKYCILLALIFLALEIILIRFLKNAS